MDSRTMNHEYRKKPIVIEAFQMTKDRGESNVDWPEWLHRAWNMEQGEPGAIFRAMPFDGSSKFRICTLEGTHTVSWNDWIIRGVEGEIYPCKDSIFQQTYEKA